MTIQKSSHKAYLFTLFYPLKNGVRQERAFPLDSLMDASSALKKIKQAAEEVLDDKGEPISLRWDESVIEFSVSEAKIFHDLVKQIKEASPSEYQVISELKELFNN